MANEDTIETAESTTDALYTPEIPEEEQQEEQQEAPQQAEEGAEGGEEGGEQEQARPVHHVPLTEHLSEREKRQAAERERDELKKRWDEFQAHQRQQQEEPQRPDFYGDPDQVYGYIESTLERRMQALQKENEDARIEDSFADMAEQHGEKFEQAFQAIQQAPPEVHLRIRRAPNPGRALMRWHGEQIAAAEINGDLDGFKQRYRDELKKDPEFRKDFMTFLETEARGGGERSNVTSLPSAGRAPGGTAHRGAAEELTTDELYTPARR